MSHSPACAAATFTSSGATIRQGPHHSAQKSTTTGSGDDSISAWNAADDETSIGSDGSGNVAWHLPHRAVRPNGTRFF